jgi:hypothetical protein
MRSSPRLVGGALLCLGTLSRRVRATTLRCWPKNTRSHLYRRLLGGPNSGPNDIDLSVLLCVEACTPFLYYTLVNLWFCCVSA